MDSDSSEGFVYLLHFERPISSNHTAQHYLGWTPSLATRVQKHRNGNGSRFCRVAAGRGIDFVVVRVWRGDRQLERRLKNRKNGRKLCPLCNSPLQMSVFELTPRQIEDVLSLF